MKSEVYTWRISTDVKTALEAEARREKRSVASLLDEATREWLAKKRTAVVRDPAEQARIRAAAEKWIGKLPGDNPLRAQSARTLIREKLARKYGRRLSD